VQKHPQRRVREAELFAASGNPRIAKKDWEKERLVLGVAGSGRRGLGSEARAVYMWVSMGVIESKLRA
jgi:hypothetical protein